MTRMQGLLIGAISFAAGVAIGMLFAPKSGRELRQELRETAKKLPDLYDDLKLPKVSSSEIERELVK
ncbi:MAG: YtxH domain-containing protein [Chloroherpetonaceae bacterium]|nr:YtxH domain-containing protein [Chloroherpetonaceae bacterium]MDW8020011.1 YtxH domain-containing protein [Chloroherpetonaceae bacterium]MDW8465821.1 YtxH domain-containing protein [Chloroherpetonaceae bacterium]